MELDKSFNQSLQRGSKKVSSMSSNGLPRNYYGALKMNLKTCVKGTKWRVYNIIFEREREREREREKERTSRVNDVWECGAHI